MLCIGFFCLRDRWDAKITGLKVAPVAMLTSSSNNTPAPVLMEHFLERELLGRAASLLLLSLSQTLRRDGVTVQVSDRESVTLVPGLSLPVPCHSQVSAASSWHPDLSAPFGGLAFSPLSELDSSLWNLGPP